MFDKCIYFNISSLSRQITKIWQDEFSLIGLSTSHGYLLAAIAEYPKATQKELSEIMELDASTITRFIDSLAAKKMIERKGVGKGATFSVTNKGFETVQKIHALMNSLFSEMQNTFGKRDFKNFVGQLRQAKNILKEIHE